MSLRKRHKILLVDDNERLMEALMRRHGSTFNLRSALGGQAALEALTSDGPYAVVVVDYQMPLMDGITLLHRCWKLAPDTVRVLLTADADLKVAIEALNRGRIFRFLSKPCPPNLFVQTMDASLENYELNRDRQELLEKSIKGSIQALTDILAKVSPVAYERSKRLQDYVRHIVSRMDLDDAWQYSLAALLSHLGCVTVPQSVVEKTLAGETMTLDQEELMSRHPQSAGEILENIPRLGPVAEMIAKQTTPEARGPSSPMDSPRVIGAKLLYTVNHFDDLLCKSLEWDQAVELMRAETGRYDPKILDILGSFNLSNRGSVIRALKIDELREGMVLVQDVVTSEGALVVTGGCEINKGLLERLYRFSKIESIPERLRVRVAEEVAL